MPLPFKRDTGSRNTKTGVLKNLAFFQQWSVTAHIHGHTDMLQTKHGHKQHSWVSQSSFIAAYSHRSDTVLVPFVFICNQRHQEHVLKLENALIFAGLATVRKAGCSF